MCRIRRYHFYDPKTDRRSQQRVDAGLGFDTERLTVVAWLDHWLTNVVTPHGEPTTTEVYEVSIRLHIKPYVGKVQLGKLTPELVEKWLQHVREFDATNPGCYIVLHARANRTSSEIIEVLKGLETSLDTITVTPKKPD